MGHQRKSAAMFGVSASAHNRTNSGHRREGSFVLFPEVAQVPSVIDGRLNFWTSVKTALNQHAV
jgi:hypothetical protein